MDEKKTLRPEMLNVYFVRTMRPYMLRNTLIHTRTLAYSVILFMQTEFHYVSKLVYILIVLFFLCVCLFYVS